MLKVAGYCRVSTDREDQANSFEAQQRFFREYILAHPDWELYEIYADEGITGTSTRKRAQFNRMIDDAYGHRFQYIVTKEISRFSRNILDTIAYTRELKALGIGVMFLSDGFCSLDPDAELRLSIMGSIAQEESRKTSCRVRWGQTRQMEQGVVFGTSLLGYDVKNGKITVNPQGAQLVRLIYQKYTVEKKGTTVIARELQEEGYKTRSGNPEWSPSHILKILKNEKYAGDLVQKKTITPDYLTHAKKYNRGQEELIVLKDHHQPIISRDLWDLTQEEIRSRHRTKQSDQGHSNRYIFSGKILCNQCGARFVSRKKVRKDGSSYRRWGCLTAVREGTRKTDSRGNVLGCDIGKQIRDDLAVDMLKFAVASLPLDRQWLIRDLTRLLQSVTCGTPDESPETIRKQQELLQNRWSGILDSYFDREITKEEFQQLRSRYEAEGKQLEERRRRLPDSRQEADRFAAVPGAIAEMLTCSLCPEAFLKIFPEYLRIQKDGRAELKLNRLDTVWKFRLYKANPYIPDR